MLGNCIYDKDYVAKVTKVKAVPVRSFIPRVFYSYVDFTRRNGILTICIVILIMPLSKRSQRRRNNLLKMMTSLLARQTLQNVEEPTAPLLMMATESLEVSDASVVLVPD